MNSEPEVLPGPTLVLTLTPTCVARSALHPQLQEEGGTVSEKSSFRTAGVALMHPGENPQGPGVGAGGYSLLVLNWGRDQLAG